MAQRATLSNVNLSILGIMNATVDLMQVKVPATTKPSAKIVCPSCSDATKMVQQYVCEIDSNHVHAPNETDRAMEVDGVLTKVDKDKLTEVKEEGLLEPGNIILSAVPAKQVASKTRPGDLAYRLRPKNLPELYATFTALIGDKDTAFIGEMTIKNVQHLFQAQVWNGVIVLQQLIRPSEIAEFDAPSDKANKQLLDMAKKFVEQNKTDFDADAFRDQAKERLVTLLNELTPTPGVTPIKKATKAKKADSNPLDAMLASIASQLK